MYMLVALFVFVGWVVAATWNYEWINDNLVPKYEYFKRGWDDYAVTYLLLLLAGAGVAWLWPIGLLVLGTLLVRDRYRSK